MYLREPFVEQDRDKIISFIESQKFATFISVGKNHMPIVSHLPVDVLIDDKSPYERRLISHLANGNPHLPTLVEQQNVMVVFLAHSNYISPSWFVDKSSAPTQSHIAVHVYGKANVINDADELFKLMNYQVNSREDSINGHWTMNELGDDGIRSRFNKISGISITIDKLEASFRLLQDESKENILGVLENAELEADSIAKIRTENGI